MRRLWLPRCRRFLIFILSILLVPGIVISSFSAKAASPPNSGFQQYIQWDEKWLCYNHVSSFSTDEIDKHLKDGTLERAILDRLNIQLCDADGQPMEVSLSIPLYRPDGQPNLQAVRAAPNPTGYEVSVQAVCSDAAAGEKMFSFLVRVPVSSLPAVPPPDGEHWQIDHYYVYFAGQLIFSAEEIGRQLQNGTLEKTLIDKAQLSIYDTQTQTAAISDRFEVAADTSAVRAQQNFNGYEVPVTITLGHWNETYFLHTFTVTINVVVTGDPTGPAAGTSPHPPAATGTPPQAVDSPVDTVPEPQADPTTDPQPPPAEPSTVTQPPTLPDNVAQMKPFNDRTWDTAKKYLFQVAQPPLPADTPSVETAPTGRLHTVLFPLTALCAVGYAIALVPDIAVLWWFERKKKARLLVC